MNVGYRSSLRNRLAELIIQESEAYNLTLLNPSLENIDKLNNLRMDIKTVKSRIANINRPSSIEEYYLPNIIYEE